MRKTTFLLTVLFLTSCAQIQESAKRVEEAFGTSGAMLVTAPYKESLPSTIEDRRFDQVSELFFATYFELNPTIATQAGLHEYDAQLGVVSRAELNQAKQTYAQLLTDLRKIYRTSLTGARALDSEILEGKLQAEILELERIQSYRKNPNYYIDKITQGVYSLTVRKFAPLKQRAQALQSRLQQIPALLAEARVNLSNPPMVFTEIALENVHGAIQFLEQDVAAVFTAADLEDQAESFHSSLNSSVAELKNFHHWLDEELRAHSHGTFALGEVTFLDKLRYEEMVEMPITKLLLQGENELSRLQKAAQITAQQAYPGANLTQAFQALGNETLPREKILTTARAGLAELRQFCVDRNLVTFPSELELIVQETPPFLRALSFASMDMPGAYEQTATEAFYSITLPTEDMPPEQQAKLQSFFNRYAIPLISIHEAYPGHFTQFLFVQHTPSKIRKLIGAASNAEGWAHYSEEMLLDEGYADNDAKLRLAQIQGALIRVCRYLAGIRMHTRNMNLTEASNFFVRHAYLNQENAEREARRGACDPTYLVYTLGKMMIKELRNDYQLATGATFQLGQFHNAFLSAGYPPIPLVRKILLPLQNSTEQ